MDLSGFVGNTGWASTIYYFTVLIVGVFCAGFYLKNRLAKLCAENNKDLEDRMKILETNLVKQTDEALKVSTYNRDMENVARMFLEIKQDMREGFKIISARIDTLLQSMSNDKG